MPIIDGEEQKSERSWYTEQNSYKVLKSDSMNGNKEKKGEYEVQEDLLDNPEDLHEERMSQLGALINQKDEIDWQNIDLTELSVLVITTHECRRSGTKEIWAPFARINDGKMYL